MSRCPTKNKPRVNNGWYVIRCKGQLITASYGDHQLGNNKIKWSNKHKLSKVERQEQLSNYLHYSQQLELEKQQKLQRCRVLYAKMSTLNKNQSHDYFIRKKINHWLRCSQIDPLKIDRVGNLVMTLRNISNELMGYQLITVQGDKKFIAGTQKKGNFYLLIADGLDIKYCLYL